VFRWSHRLTLSFSGFDRQNVTLSGLSILQAILASNLFAAKPMEQMI